ncbi:MAG: TIGR00730 family Rossman fold protein [Pelagibacteraceae bacterium]|nr:TIGR00730 family Rossman fold protein [Pelagibacteraceae bacterium]|tara:strand:+ start:318 stop:869 length:552 start_codon:yes stop_codon:yes gene_type:complete
MIKAKIAVFCGSMKGPNLEHQVLAKKITTYLVKENYGIIYGGGQNGLMGIVANTALDLGGQVTGIIPEFLDNREKINKRLNKLIITKTMEERKKIFLNKADFFLALPGGGGTIEEISLVISANQLKIIKNKPIIIYNYKNYWSGLIKQYQVVPSKNYSKKDILSFFTVCKNLKELSKLLPNKL